MSVKFLSTILGPEMAAPILWAPSISAFFLQETSMSIKFLVLGGGGYFGLGGGVPILFLWARGFFGPTVPANQARKLRQKLRRKLRQQLRPRTAPHPKRKLRPKLRSCRNPLLTFSAFPAFWTSFQTYRRGIGVGVKGVTGRDAIVHKRRRNSSQKARQ